MLTKFQKDNHNFCSEVEFLIGDKIEKAGGEFGDCQHHIESNNTIVFKFQNRYLAWKNGVVVTGYTGGGNIVNVGYDSDDFLAMPEMAAASFVMTMLGIHPDSETSEQVNKDFLAKK